MNDDVLPSWRDTPTRRAIIDFVKPGLPLASRGLLHGVGLRPPGQGWEGVWSIRPLGVGNNPRQIHCVPESASAPRQPSPGDLAPQS